MIEKALASAADVVMIDLEDAVAPAEKAAARETVATALREETGAAGRARSASTRWTPLVRPRPGHRPRPGEGQIDLTPSASGPADVKIVSTILTSLENRHRQDPSSCSMSRSKARRPAPEAIAALPARVLARLRPARAISRGLSRRPRRPSACRTPGCRLTRAPLGSTPCSASWSCACGGRAGHRRAQYADFRDLERSTCSRAWLPARSATTASGAFIRPEKPVANEVFRPQRKR